ncbi:MAG TPA: insulinase family protein [Ghiorsea sp.]|nr:insulinase family protein [Ghiorsea sp.]HIP07883.1 insulinase family protein [Mariprofundaceae bacterium]
MMQTEQHFYDKSTLDNGVQIASRELPKAQTVAIGIFMDVGNRDEAPHQAGIAHALEHMVFKGTDKLDVHELAESLDALGGNANAFTSRERTCFHIHVLFEDWKKAIRLISDMLLHPALPNDEWQREREVIFSEMSMVDDNPDEWVYDQHMAQVFAGNPMGTPVLGSRETLGAFSVQDLRDYLNQHYRGGNVLIAAAGRISHQALLAEVGQSDWAQAKAGEREARVAPVMHTGKHALSRQMEQAQVVASWASIHVTSAEKPVAWVVNQLLGGSMSSVLFREIREKRGLAYSIGSHLSTYTDSGLFGISASTMPEQLEPCLEVLNQVMADVCQGVSGDKITRAKRQLIVQFRMGMDAVEGSMMQLGGLLDDEIIYSPLVWVDKVQAVTPSQVHEFLQQYLATDAAWTIATPS